MLQWGATADGSRHGWHDNWRCVHIGKFPSISMGKIPISSLGLTDILTLLSGCVPIVGLRPSCADCGCLHTRTHATRHEPPSRVPVSLSHVCRGRGLSFLAIIRPRNPLSGRFSVSGQKNLADRSTGVAPTPIATIGAQEKPKALRNSLSRKALSRVADGT